MGKYETCAQAVPGPMVFQGVDSQTPCQVTVFCRNAQKRDGIYTLQDAGLCLTCPQYADRSKVIRIRNGSFMAEILFDRLVDFPDQNLCKLFDLMLSAEWENEASIASTTAYLDAAVPDSKRAWDAASMRYQREWRLIEKPAGPRTREDIARDAAIRAHNDELTRAVKKAKRKHKRWMMIQALWNDRKHKMNIK